MQRSFLARTFSRVAVLSGIVGGSVISKGKGNQLFSCASKAITVAPITVSHSIRFYSGGHEEEPPTRTGQYLLDKNDVLTRVLEVVKNFEKVDAAKVTPESHFVNDLGLNSLDVVEVVFAIEQEFILDIPDHDAEKLQSIPDTVEYISQNPMAK